MNVLLQVCCLVLLLLLVLLCRKKSGVRFVVTLISAVILAYNCLHMLTAYREVATPKDVSREVWNSGVLALQDHLTSEYIPIVIVCGLVLVVLALLPAHAGRK